jgi:hypothetical protein
MKLPVGATLVLVLMLFAACSPSSPPPSGDAAVPYGPEAMEGDY